MTDLPLQHPWERAAAKELSELLWVLATGNYANCGELVFKLRDIAGYLEAEFSQQDVSDDARAIFQDVMQALTGWDYTLDRPRPIIQPELPLLPGGNEDG
ncbi:MAG TPA: hypothetical protein V6C65_40255 [Allocoleopsis sp.]